MSDQAVAQDGRHHGPVNWAALFGRWGFEGGKVEYLEGAPWGVFEEEAVVGGLALSSLLIRNGTVSVKVAFSEILPSKHQGAGVVLGYVSANEPYLFAQLGAGGFGYSLGEFTPRSGWRPLLVAGSKSNLQQDTNYELKVTVRGAKIWLRVDGVQIFEYVHKGPVSGQIGLIAAGGAKVRFVEFTPHLERPRVFVAMQFAEPFDTIYREVIKPEAELLQFQVVRIDELARPGIIFEDIKREIAESNVVIAEITAPNQNVFYELGYAHALNKPTILLAQRGKELPFDIRSYRVIFYDDSIGGKPEVERHLHNHLQAVLQEA
jgi:hypothetical protein